MAIERAAIVLDDKMVECRTDVAIDDGMMKLVSMARGGKITADVSDNLSFPNHARTYDDTVQSETGENWHGGV